MSALNTDQFNVIEPAGPLVAQPVDFLNRLMECLPPNYRPPENQDFLRRLFLPNAENLARMHTVFDHLFEYLDPFAAPIDWVKWITTEWMGWTLIPDGYPEARQRKLLAHLLADLDNSGIGYHYQHRYSIAGIRNLLLEFGVHAIVTDAPMYCGGYLGWDNSGSIFPAMVGASPNPLSVRVIVQYYDPSENDQNTYVGGYPGSGPTSTWDSGAALGELNTQGVGVEGVGLDVAVTPVVPGNIFLYQAGQLVTDDFVVRLCEWERAAGTQFLVEWRTARFKSDEVLTLVG
jgi:hypothetical protein